MSAASGAVAMVPMAAVMWAAGDDTGASSMAIWAQMTGAVPRYGFSYPLDPDDFGRCYRLLERVPEWKSRIGEMALHGRQWAGLAAAWDELTALWEEEIGPGVVRRYGLRAPKLYARMKEIENAAHAGGAHGR